MFLKSYNQPYYNYCTACILNLSGLGVRQVQAFSKGKKQLKSASRIACDTRPNPVSRALKINFTKIIYKQTKQFVESSEFTDL